MTTNRDGTKTIISYSLNDDGKKVKSTRRIRTRVVKETVNPRVAERKEWAKFGLESKRGPGPSSETTTVGENILFRPSVTWRKDGKDEAKKAEEESVRDKLRDKKVKCRICSGDHFTAHCPFKDTIAPAGEDSGVPDGPTGATAAGLRDEPAEGKLGSGSKSYVPPALRNGGGGSGERMGSKYERDDLATLRVTNVSALCPRCASRAPLIYTNRFLRWPRKAIYGLSLNASAASRECSWPKIVRLDGPKGLHSSALLIAWTLSALATSSMDICMSTWCSKWSSRSARTSSGRKMSVS